MDMSEAIENVRRTATLSDNARQEALRVGEELRKAQSLEREAADDFYVAKQNLVEAAIQLGRVK